MLRGSKALRKHRACEALGQTSLGEGVPSGTSLEGPLHPSRWAVRCVVVSREVELPVVHGEVSADGTAASAMSPGWHACMSREVHFEHRGRLHVYNLSAFSVYSGDALAVAHTAQGEELLKTGPRGFRRGASHASCRMAEGAEGRLLGHCLVAVWAAWTQHTTHEPPRTVSGIFEDGGGVLKGLRECFPAGRIMRIGLADDQRCLTRSGGSCQTH